MTRFSAVCLEGNQFVARLQYPLHADVGRPFDFMFPDAHDLPPPAPELSEVPLISLPRCGDLVPPFWRQFVLPEWKSPSVPEVTVDEDRELDPAKHDVWASRQVSCMATKRNVVTSEHAAKRTFRARVLASYASHDHAAFLGRHDVTSVSTRHRSVPGRPCAVPRFSPRRGHRFSAICQLEGPGSADHRWRRKSERDEKFGPIASSFPR